MNRKIAFLICALILGLIITIAGERAGAAEKIWTGSGDGSLWADASNWTGGVPSTWDDIRIMNGTSTQNNISGLRLASVQIHGSSSDDTYISGNSFKVAGEINDYSSEGDGSTIVLNNIGAAGTVRLSAFNYASLAFFGDFYMNSYNLGIRSYDSGYVYLFGNVYGSGKVVVGGSGNGVIVAQDVSAVRPFSVKEGGTLFGATAKIGSVSVDSSGSFGPIGCIGIRNLSLKGYIYAYIDGYSQCSEYGRINAVGKVDITGGTLSTRYALSDSFAPRKGSKFVVISNDGTDKVVGTFKNRPEGSTFKMNGLNFKISYKGGSGNDVVITRI